MLNPQPLHNVLKLLNNGHFVGQTLSTSLAHFESVTFSVRGKHITIPTIIDIGASVNIISYDC